MANKKRQTVAPNENAKVELNPGDNTKFLDLSLTLASLPKINVREVEEVKERVREFFIIHMNADVKPTIAGLALALGITTDMLWRVRNGESKRIPLECVFVIQYAYTIMENQWEYYMLNGKLNPVSGIFLAKQRFGYSDQVKPVNNQIEADERLSIDDIRRRYLSAEELAEYEAAEKKNSPETPKPETAEEK